MRRLLKAQSLVVPRVTPQRWSSNERSHFRPRGDLLRQMLRIRRFEERCAELYSGAKIRGFMHLSIGEEAGSSRRVTSVSARTMPSWRPIAMYGVIYPPLVVMVGFGKVRERPWAEAGMIGVLHQPSP